MENWKDTEVENCFQRRMSSIKRSVDEAAQDHKVKGKRRKEAKNLNKVKLTCEKMYCRSHWGTVQ